MKGFRLWVGVTVAIIIAAVLFLVYSKMNVDVAEGAKNIRKQFVVEATAFNDSHLCDGTKPKKNCTLAGKREWLGQTAMLWLANDDGTPGEFMGYYEFHDVGYGKSVGYGRSRLIKGRSLGSIETGKCIDIWMKTNLECRKWGRRKLVIQILDAKG